MQNDNYNKVILQHNKDYHKDLTININPLKSVEFMEELNTLITKYSIKEDIKSKNLSIQEKKDKVFSQLDEWWLWRINNLLKDWELKEDAFEMIWKQWNSKWWTQEIIGIDPAWSPSYIVESQNWDIRKYNLDRINDIIKQNEYDITNEWIKKQEEFKNTMEQNEKNIIEAKQKEEKEEKEFIESLAFYLTYIEEVSDPKQKARIIKFLASKTTHKGQLMTNKAWGELLINEWYKLKIEQVNKIKDRPRSWYKKATYEDERLFNKKREEAWMIKQYRLQSDSTYYIIEKTLYDYLDYMFNE